MKMMMRRIILAGVALVVALGSWFLLQVYPIGSPGQYEIVRVGAGESWSSIGVELSSQHVISSALAFRMDLAWHGAPLVRPGSYEIRRGEPYDTIIRTLSEQPNYRQVVVSPGNTLREIEAQILAVKGTAFALAFHDSLIHQLESNGFWQGGPAEGLIGPGVYRISHSVSAASLATSMVKSFDRMISAVHLGSESRLGVLSAYQLITVASIVQKEGYYPSNMPRVARVIFNRLERKSSLQMDATILYALGRDGGVVTPAMLKIRSPYNTYLNAGLTPTPICVISTDALAATLHPATGSWLYFVVVTKDGQEAFSTTFAQQLANEKLARSRGL
jgi:UPF0755 protein